jgi:hypothetical protein
LVGETKPLCLCASTHDDNNTKSTTSKVQWNIFIMQNNTKSMTKISHITELVAILKMKHILTIFATLNFFVACTNQNSTADNNSPDLVIQEKEADNSGQFLDLFKEIYPENLHIYKPDDLKDGDKFKGKKY